MTLLGRARALGAEATVWASDAWWAVPLGIYHLSGRRLARSSQLYRAGVPRQERRRNLLPGMTSTTERAYYKWHAQEIFTGNGTVVDLGSWFGSTTATMAMGLCANGRTAAKDARIHAFDRFVWEPWMEPYAQGARLGPYAPGDSFLPEFERVVLPWHDRIEVHAGDLCEQTWRGGPIELLLIDAMKSWDVTHCILAKFFGALIPDQGHVIHQDFSHCFTPWIHLVTYRLREHLLPVQDIPRSEAVVFQVVRPCEHCIDTLSFRRTSFGETDVSEAFKHSLRITRPEKHSGIHAARAMLLAYDGDLKGARELLESMEREGRVNEFHVQAVRGAIERGELPDDQ